MPEDEGAPETDRRPGPARGRRPTSSGRPRPPSVERLLAAARPTVGAHDRAAVLAATREIVAHERARLLEGATPRDPVALGSEVARRLEQLRDSRAAGPVRVLNATGVILHTNLGRAPWPDAAIVAAEAAERDYLLLELDRDEGRRGRRYRVAEDHLVALTGAEDALVVNNNAAALALAVGLAGRRGVAVARGELVEIGGGVRIPEIVRRAGARLVEVGTTNRTRVQDFAEILADGRVAVVLRVHPSNFRQAGFVEVPEPRALAVLAHESGAIVVDDLGSGALLDTAAFGLAHEPQPRERLRDGSDVVTFSGDKLVGGPQAGLIVGRGDLVGRLRRDPLARAMRPDKSTLAAVAATLALYRAGVAAREIPIWRTIAIAAETLRRRAEAIAATLRATRRTDGVSALRPGAVSAVEVASTVGGGSLPGETLPSWAVSLAVRSPDRLLARLRRGSPCVVGRVASGCVLLDLRTVPGSADPELEAAIIAALGAGESARTAPA